MGLSSWPRGYIQSLNELHWGPRRSYTSPFSHRKPSARVLPLASRLSRAASAWLLVATTTRIVRDSEWECKQFFSGSMTAIQTSPWKCHCKAVGCHRL